MDEPGPSRPKRNYISREYETRIEQMLFESDSDENFDLTDSGSEYMGENIEFSESDDEISDIEQNINTQTQLRITNNETEIIWDCCVPSLNRI
jgi:hypothetical protein